MHFSAVFATLFLLAGFVSAQCPPHSKLVAKHDHCFCEKDGHFTPFDSKCHVTFHQGECHAVCPTHTPSHHGHSKRQQLILNDDGSIANCPPNKISCPIDPTMDMGNECISPLEDLDNCGGCVALGQGIACDQVSGVGKTECSHGRCINRSCKSGWVLDRTNNCVPHLKRRWLNITYFRYQTFFLFLFSFHNFPCPCELFSFVSNLLYLFSRIL